jgi:hypothetical protein
VHFSPGHFIHAMTHAAMAAADPKALKAAADRNHQNTMRLGDDVIHLAQLAWRIVTWPLRFALRLLRRR